MGNSFTSTSASAGSGDLVTNSRAIQNATLSALNTSNASLLASLISAASAAIKRYCNRDFVSTSYTEYFDGGPYPYDTLRLSAFPVIQVDRVATSPQPALIVTNTDTTNNARATVAITATGLTLVRVAAGVSHTDTLAFGDYPTLGEIATAIGALANGWTAQVQGTFGGWPSSDFRPVQGALTALQGATLELYTEDYAAWAPSDLYFSGEYGFLGTQQGWRLDADTGVLMGRFPQGVQNIRVDYTAGFSTIPADIQEACVALVQDLYQSELINNNLKSENLGPYSYTLNDLSNRVAISPRIAGILDRYKDYSRTHAYR